MDTVKEFFESIYDSYRDRVKSPLIGSLILSTLVFNWKAVAILLFSEWPMHCRIEWIELNYCNWYNYVVPIFISLFYVLLLPHINIGIEWLLQGNTKRKQKKIDDLETARLLKRKANAKILRQIADEKAGTSEISKLNERNEALAIENNNLIEQNKNDLDRHNSLIQQYKVRDEDNKRENTNLHAEIESLKDQVKYYNLRRHFSGVKNKIIEVDKILEEKDKIEFFHFFDEKIKSNKSIANPLIQKLKSLEILYIQDTDNDQVKFAMTDYGIAYHEFLESEGYDLL